MEGGEAYPGVFELGLVLGEGVEQVRGEVGFEVGEAATAIEGFSNDVGEAGGYLVEGAIRRGGFRDGIWGGGW